MKESLGEWKEIVETCAAFATARGGRILIGVTRNGKVCGIQIGKGTLEDLANKIAQHTSPRLVPSISVQAREGESFILVSVPESPSKPVFAFDRAYRRAGRTNQRLSPDEAAQLYLESRGLTWDETAVAGATRKDIDSESVRQFLRRARVERRWAISPETATSQVLSQLGLIRAGKLTQAGILLFGKNPQRFLPQATLRCARFKGPDTTKFLDMKVVEGGIIEQIEAALAFARRHLSMAAEISGLERTERWDYPLSAIREALVNAICHRDYASTGTVQVRVFDDSLEIWNPGGLPPGLSVADLRQSHESRPRNKLIARAFFLIGYVEQFGTGTRRMIGDCRDADLPEPEFDSRPDAFRVVFRKSVPVAERFAGLRLSDRQLRAISHVLAAGRLTRRDYERLTGVTPATAKRDLADLVEKGVIVQRGATRNVWYEMGTASHFPNEPKVSRK